MVGSEFRLYLRRAGVLLWFPITHFFILNLLGLEFGSVLWQIYLELTFVFRFVNDAAGVGLIWQPSRFCRRGDIVKFVNRGSLLEWIVLI
jgi:hypothetical protein